MCSRFHYSLTPCLLGWHIQIIVQDFWPHRYANYPRKYIIDNLQLSRYQSSIVWSKFKNYNDCRWQKRKLSNRKCKKCGQLLDEKKIFKTSRTTSRWERDRTEKAPEHKCFQKPELKKERKGLFDMLSFIWLGATLCIKH